MNTKVSSPATPAQQEKDESPPGRPERPIETQAEDALERSPFVRRLTDALIDPRTGKARGLAIGITGPWGSGKSSVLNLLRQNIKTTYPKSVVVSFDPWLVSGRNDLISQFFTELIRTINTDPKIKDQLRGVANTIAKYGEYLAPVASIWIPLLGPIIKGGSTLIKDAVKSDESLTGLKMRLMKELAAVNLPIVVLIDEVDRVEDDEIRSIAQLVRSVADFPGVSYVLAYDPKRVIQALGGAERDDTLRDERGKAYLEKIVQLQIPLPVTFGEEISQLIAAELLALQKELNLPNNFKSIERYNSLKNILVSELIHTPRDVSRLIGTYHALAGMLRNEVDWIDLLGYCALLIKAPQTVDKIRLNPDEFSEEVLSEAAMIRRMAEKEMSVDDRLKTVIPASEDNAGVRRILGFLFPIFSDDSRARRDDEARPDTLARRRPLLSTLRLGLLPGEYARSEIDKLIASESDEVAATLHVAYENDRLAQLTERLEAVYNESPEMNHVRFWMGVAQFLRKPDCDWIASYNPMHEVVQTFAEIMERCVLRNPGFAATATSVFSNLRNADEDELVSCWIRRQIFRHGLFGRELRSENAPILDAEQTKAVAVDLSHKWRGLHLSGKLIPCRWDLMPLYTMLDTGLWDEPCLKALDAVLVDDRALDAFTLMLYGGVYTADRGSVEKMCTYEEYVCRVEVRLASTNLHETVRTALMKAKGGGW
jgi:KAP family P-loop domain